MYMIFYLFTFTYTFFAKILKEFVDELVKEEFLLCIRNLTIAISKETFDEKHEEKLRSFMLMLD